MDLRQKNFQNISLHCLYLKFHPITNKEFDIVVVGASFAGSSFVRNIRRENNWRVLLIDSKKTIGETVESTGLITEHTRHVFKSFFDIDPHITNKITTIGVISTDFEDHFFSEQSSAWIYQTDTKALIKELAPKNYENVTILPETRYVRNEKMDTSAFTK